MDSTKIKIFCSAKDNKRMKWQTRLGIFTKHKSDRKLVYRKCIRTLKIG